MKKQIRFSKSLEINIPKGTKIITNDGQWLTLAKRVNTVNIDILTIPVDEINSVDFNDDNRWTEFRPEELRKILKEIK